jgi:hypothetical protein
MDNGAEVSTGATRTCDLKAFGPVAAGVIKEEVGTWVYVCMYVCICIGGGEYAYVQHLMRRSVHMYRIVYTYTYRKRRVNEEDTVHLMCICTCVYCAAEGPPPAYRYLYSSRCTTTHTNTHIHTLLFYSILTHTTLYR